MIHQTFICILFIIISQISVYKFKYTFWVTSLLNKLMNDIYIQTKMITWSETEVLRRLIFHLASQFMSWNVINKYRDNNNNTKYFRVLQPLFKSLLNQL